MNKKILGRKIKKYRLKANLTQQQLADKIGKERNYISAIECGTKSPSLSLFITIANELNASTDYLLKESLKLTLSEPKKTYYTDEQLSALGDMLDTYSEHFLYNKGSSITY
ncbi:MAG: helix-turn-helix transcriptional regulator [Clostridia bacterium]|nr:helix-turn-helix transcriptional regulator [Clostridia bacterium]